MNIKKLLICILCMYSSVTTADSVVIDINSHEWIIVCISGVKYFSRFGRDYTPYYKPDGSLHTCIVKTN